jgi:hypothetical protein
MVPLVQFLSAHVFRRLIPTSSRSSLRIRRLSRCEHGFPARKFCALTVLLANIVSGFAEENTQALLKELAASGTTGPRRSELVEKLSSAPFAEVATQLAEMILEVWQPKRSPYTNQGIFVMVTYSPNTDKPWLREDFPEVYRIGFAASRIWHNIIDRSPPGSLSEPLAKLSTEARPTTERLFYLAAMSQHHYDRRSRAMIEILATDAGQPPQISVRAAAILFGEDDPNAFAGTLIRACERFKDPRERAVHFASSTQGGQGKLSSETRKTLLNYGFALLIDIDDGKTGVGVNLARELGVIAGHPRYPGVFDPDRRLPEYQGKHGMNEKNVQAIVDNALAWWRKNMRTFATEE